MPRRSQRKRNQQTPPSPYTSPSMPVFTPLKSNMTSLTLSTVFFLSVSAFSVLRLIFSSLRQAISRLMNPLSVLSSYLGRTATGLTRALDASLNQAFFGHSGQLSTIPLLPHHKLGLSLYDGGGAEGEDAECTICMCTVEHGDEIRELQCNHLFHAACLDRWIELNHLECPLCRGLMASPRAISELGAEVLFFKFCDFSSNDREDTWWLR